jgi:hypothetical protein
MFDVLIQQLNLELLLACARSCQYGCWACCTGHLVYRESLNLNPYLYLCHTFTHHCRRPWRPTPTLRCQPAPHGSSQCSTTQGQCRMTPLGSLTRTRTP